MVAGMNSVADPMRELILPKLETVHKTGSGFMARCPAHEDGKASLSISSGKDQPVVLHCHAGCDPDSILERLGLSWADICSHEEHVPAGEWTPAGPAVAVYDYRDETGTLLFQVLRTASKEFRQRIPDPTTKSGWAWRLGDVRRVLYRLDNVMEAVKNGREVWIAEGEKDVLRLEGEGVVATCNPGGAGKWRPEYSEVLREAIVTIVADRDEPGRAHARQVRDSLLGVATCVRIVEALSGKDASDHLNAGFGLHEVSVAYASDEEPTPELAPDLWEFINTDDEAYDWVVPGLLERLDRLMLTGAEGLGKSMLIRQMATCIAAGLDPFTFEEIEPRQVLLVDCENSERQSRRKFRPLAAASITAQRRVPDGNLRLIHRPEGIDLTRTDDAAWLTERVTVHRPDVLFIGPFYRLHAANLNEELPARKTIAVLDQIRVRANCALVVEAHAGHGDAGSRPVRPIGSSLLLRWPEFGYGLRVDDDDPNNVGGLTYSVVVQPWRGARDERNWPTELVRNAKPGGWPWVVP